MKWMMVFFTSVISVAGAQTLVFAQDISSSLEQELSSYFETKPGSLQYVLKQESITDQIFKLDRDQYIRHVKGLEDHRRLHPQPAIDLAQRLQVRWESVCGSTLKKYYDDLSVATRVGIGVSLAASALSLATHPWRAPVYFQIFRSAYPAVLAPTIEVGATAALKYPSTTTCPPAPAHLLSLSDHVSVNEMELQKNMEALIAMSGAIGVSTSATVLMNLGRASGYLKIATGSAGEVARQMAVMALIFSLTERTLLDTATYLKWNNAIHDLEVARPKLVKANTSDTPSFVALEEFNQAAKQVLHFLSQDQYLLISQTEEKLKEVIEKSEQRSNEETTAQVERVYSEFMDQLKRLNTKDSHTGRCHLEYLRFQTLVALTSGDPSNIENVLAQLGNDLLVQSYHSRALVEVEKDRQKWPTFALSAPQREALEREYYKFFLDEMKSKIVQDFTEGRYCRQSNMFKLQVELFLRSLKIPGAQLAADEFRPSF